MHSERREHDGTAVHEDGVVDVSNETRDVEQRRNGEDAVAFSRFYDLELPELVALGDDVVVGEHDGFG